MKRIYKIFDGITIYKITNNSEETYSIHGIKDISYGIKKENFEEIINGLGEEIFFKKIQEFQNFHKLKEYFEKEKELIGCDLLKDEEYHLYDDDKAMIMKEKENILKIKIGDYGISKGKFFINELKDEERIKENIRTFFDEFVLKGEFNENNFERVRKITDGVVLFKRKRDGNFFYVKERKGIIESIKDEGGEYSIKSLSLLRSLDTNMKLGESGNDIILNELLVSLLSRLLGINCTQNCYIEEKREGIIINEEVKGENLSSRIGNYENYLDILFLGYLCNFSDFHDGNIKIVKEGEKEYIVLIDNEYSFGNKIRVGSLFSRLITSITDKVDGIIRFFKYSLNIDYGYINVRNKNLNNRETLRTLSNRLKKNKFEIIKLKNNIKSIKNFIVNQFHYSQKNNINKKLKIVEKNLISLIKNIEV